MSRQAFELETLLAQQIAEHAKLLKAVDAHHAAMKSLDLKAMESSAVQQEAARLRIATLETKRRTLIGLIAKAHHLSGPMTVADVAKLYPPRASALLKLRQDLMAAVAQVAQRTSVAGKVAGAVLGHLNTVVRLLAGAVEQAGLYTKQGVPHLSTRIGVMDAVG